MAKTKGHQSNMQRCMTVARRQAVLTFLSEMEIIARKRTRHQRRKACRKYIRHCDVSVFLEE